MPKIFLYGSFDRFNYGDILFPLIFQKYIKSDPQLAKDYKIKFISPFKGDETKRGGIKTICIKSVFKKIKRDDILIIVGGDVLTASWFHLYLHRYGVNIKFRILYKMLTFITNDPNNSMDKCIRYMHGDGDLKKPYSVNRNNKQFKLIYNSVGGASINPEIARKYYSEIIKSANVFTVRDKITKSKLPEQELIDITPDIAILVKDFLPTETPNSIVHNNGYFVFQIGNTFLSDDNTPLIANELNEIVIQTGLKLVLLPIGTAHGHEDHIALKKLTLHLKENSYHLIDNPDIQEIQNVISHSIFFIGTSLHGAITSMSYYKPHFILKFGISKLNGYLKTWQIDPFIDELEINSFSQIIIKFLESSFSYEAYEDHINKQKSLMLKQLQSYNKIILDP